MRKLFLGLICLMTLSLHAVDYCAMQSWGYAGTSVTGGGNATPTLVTNESQLTAALNNNNRVILITQDITVTNHISSDKNNLTIMALPGKKLISNDQTQENSGILYLKGNNLLLRNLTFVGPGAYDIDGWDLLCLDKATNVWVDHCDFQDGCDGNFDIKGKSDNVTVTWCRFRYLKPARARECDLTDPDCAKLTDDHRFSNLVGSGATDAPTDGTYNITWAYCWWDNGCKARMTRCRNASQHFLNCYWNSSNAESYIGPQNADCYVEGCYIDGAVAKSRIFFQNYGGTNGVTFINCISKKGVPDDVTDRTVLVPTYSYTALSAAEAKSAVTNASCGAGATLTVTNSAEVSSSCDSETPPVGPTYGALTWNFSDSQFSTLDSATIAAGVTVNGLFIKGPKAVIDQSFKEIDGYSFTHRFKTAGSGAAGTERYLSFSVTGTCTLHFYLASANGNTLRYMAIADTSGELATVEAATGNTPVLQSYVYNGGATTIYLYSTNSGINIYGIQVQYAEPDTPSDVETTKTSVAARKILRDGQVLIERDGKMYTILGNIL